MTYARLKTAHIPTANLFSLIPYVDPNGPMQCVRLATVEQVRATLNAFDLQTATPAQHRI